MEGGAGKFFVFRKGRVHRREGAGEEKGKGVRREVMAFKMTEKSPPPRPHYAILAGCRKVGEITSGTPSPTLGVGIGMGYIETAEAQVGKPIEIEIRGKRFPAVIEKKPILKRGQ